MEYAEEFLRLSCCYAIYSLLGARLIRGLTAKFANFKPSYLRCYLAVASGILLSAAGIAAAFSILNTYEWFRYGHLPVILITAIVAPFAVLLPMQALSYLLLLNPPGKAFLPLRWAVLLSIFQAPIVFFLFPFFLFFR